MQFSGNESVEALAQVGSGEDGLTRAAAALDRNRRLQGTLRDALKVLDEADAASDKQHGLLQSYVVEQSGESDRTFRRQTHDRRISFFSAASDRKLAPPKNLHAVRRELFREAYLLSLGSLPWSETEEKQLENVLKATLQEEAFHRLYAERTQQNQCPQTDKQRTFLVLCREIREANVETLWTMQEGKTDWQRVSGKLAARGVSRDAQSCFTHWIQSMQPRVNHGSFTKQEDMALLQLATENASFDWEGLSSRLETCRTPWQCFVRYQRSLNASLLGSSWSPEEDRRLLAVAGQAGVLASRTLERLPLAPRLGGGRLQCQTSTRLKVLLNEHLGKPWSPWESRRLRLAESVYGVDDGWVKIGRLFPRRTVACCFARFCTVERDGMRLGKPFEKNKNGVLRKKRRSVPWTEEEDAQLLEAIDHFGAGNWSRIQHGVPGRTSAQCFCRFQELNPCGMADMYDILLATKRKMMPRFMMRRKRRRSALVSSDFSLHLYGVAPSAGDRAGSRGSLVLTTGKPELDRHLRRVNRRFEKQYRRKALDDEAVDVGSTGNDARSLPLTTGEAPDTSCIP